MSFTGVLHYRALGSDSDYTDSRHMGQKYNIINNIWVNMCPLVFIHTSVQPPATQIVCFY